MSASAWVCVCVCLLGSGWKQPGCWWEFVAAHWASQSHVHHNLCELTGCVYWWFLYLAEDSTLYFDTHHILTVFNVSVASFTLIQDSNDGITCYLNHDGLLCRLSATGLVYSPVQCHFEGTPIVPAACLSQPPLHMSACLTLLELIASLRWVDPFPLVYVTEVQVIVGKIKPHFNYRRSFPFNSFVRVRLVTKSHLLRCN